jgi:hypothetical protein
LNGVSFVEQRKEKEMCQRTTCPECGRPSFVGCGRHVESVLADVPVAERCQCRASRTVTGSGEGARGWRRLLEMVKVKAGRDRRGP